MPAADLLVFDFDGVIVDGMQEYWWSAWHACRRLEAAPEGSLLIRFLTPSDSCGRGSITVGRWFCWPRSCRC